MEKKNITVKRIYTFLYALFFMTLLIFIVFRTSYYDPGIGGRITDFSEGWTDGYGRTVNLTELNDENYLDGRVTIQKTLPWDLTDDDYICFETKNVNVSVVIYDREVYRFTASENITGHGYGFAYHQVKVTGEDAKKPVRITYDFVVPGKAGGKIQQICLCPATDYLKMVIRDKSFIIILSLIIIFFGMVIIFVYACMPKSRTIPFDFLALGVTTFMAGGWALIDTNVPQLVTGHIYFWRGLNKIMILLAGYPYISFFLSLTREGKSIYRRIMFWLDAFFVGYILFMRYFAGEDMIYSFSKVMAVMIVCVLVLIIIIAIDNRMYCRAHGLRSNMSYFFLGFTVLWGSALVDVVLFLNGVFISDSFGTCARIGMMAFVLIMLFQFFTWWTKDQATIGRDRFVNRALQYALGSDNPEYGIRSMLEYIGTELRGERAFVFELRPGGSLHGIYEWVDEGLPPLATEIDLPYKGLVENYVEDFKKDHKFVIEDPEDYRESDPVLYETLQRYEVHRMVIGPLEANGKLIGLLGVDELPRDHIEESAEIIRTMAYFMTQLILQRDAQDKLSYFSYNDALTGVKNRHAFREFVEKKMDLSASFGLVMCDINGLKLVNDTMGHDTGDKLIKNTSKCLTDVFGLANVYRMGGDEFVALGFETDETYFRNDVERVKRLLSEHECSTSIGSVYCVNGTTDIARVESQADMLMYRQKQEYYKTHDRRNR
ncbi:MAG: sensor domain-containing diguanylate cyclase [Lachnospiraceae bacterium]|nr:sensor domain-containing diguanylate cyclase [Lachnospiraceae bacterium]